mgnify:FL=1|tara:strand:- start:1101 stop:1667 length:567 start_codon:yes stop_codon:yes gene_type:complete
MDLKDYVRHYPLALDPSLCRNIIDLGKKTELERWEQKGRPQWNMFNITHEIEKENPKDEWVKIHQQLIQYIKRLSEIYMAEVKCKDFWPIENSFEQIKLKHYDKEKNDRFDLHVDVGNHDSARRFLALFFYLNDVDKGGETCFHNIDYSVQPKEGSALVFPPSWMFPHSGKAPLSHDKWVVSTYLHYL